MRMNFRKLTYYFSIFLIIFNGCDSELSEPTAFDNTKYPEAPTNLQASIGDGVVVLTWSHPEPEKVDSYNVYRKSDVDSELKKVGTTDLMTFTDSNLRNGISYSYQVSAVGKNGFEGAKSKAVDAVPAVYGVIINSGNEYTNSRSVVLTLIAPSATSYMIVSNDSLFSNAQWEPFSGTKVWTLTEGDGVKTVYIKFKDSESRETFKPLTDQITLDTIAIIKEVTEDTEGEIKAAGETIHFSLDAGEPGGTAFVDIEVVGCSQCSQRGITLFDNGSQGDGKSNDGIYHRNFVIPNGFEVINAKIVGHFTDRIGNRAESLEAESRITIQNPPTAVTLLKPEPQGSSTSLRISWTLNVDQDFASYKLYRSKSPNVTLDSTLVTTIESQTTLNFIDRDLKGNTIYYYRMYVFDTSGRYTGSNEEYGATLPNEPPEPVTLTKPTQIDSVTLRLSWTQSTDVDFASYRIYRSEFSPVDTTEAPIGIINNDAAITFYDDRGLQKNVLYFYRVFVFDKNGLSAGSNEVSGRLNQ